MTIIIDLTKPLYNGIEVYKENEYSDPAFKITSWCDVADQGYCVAKVELGTQTGTHIDAPRHFLSTGDTLDKLPVQNLIGSYVLIDIKNYSNLTLTNADRARSFLFLRFHPNEILPVNEFKKLLKCDHLVWIIAGIPDIENLSPHQFQLELAKAGKYLVENIDDANAGKVKPDGLMIVSPLPLVDVSGSPCRVFVLYE